MPPFVGHPPAGDRQRGGEVFWVGSQGGRHVVPLPWAIIFRPDGAWAWRFELTFDTKKSILPNQVDLLRESESRDGRDGMAGSWNLPMSSATDDGSRCHAFLSVVANRADLQRGSESGAEDARSLDASRLSSLLN